MDYLDATAEFDRLEAQINKLREQVSKLPRRVVSGWEYSHPFPEQKASAMLFVQELGKGSRRDSRRIAFMAKYRDGYTIGFDEHLPGLRQYAQGASREDAENFLRAGLAERNILVSPDVDLTLE